MNNYKNLKKILLILNALCILFFAGEAVAANVGESVNFNTESNFDVSARSQITAELIKSSTNLIFYT